MKSTTRFAFLALVAFAPALALAQESASCLSTDSRAFPPASKPYVLVIADTSGSMTTDLAIATSCNFGTDRRAHQRCAIGNAIRAYSGVANFALMTYARRQSTCGASCFGTCTYSDYPGDASGLGCGTGTAATRRGGFIQVPMLQDSFWTTPPPADNTAQLSGWTDNTCTGNTELFANGSNALNGALRDAKRYFSAAGWTAQDNSVTYATPLAAQDLGTPTAGCRPVRVILISDGAEACDTAADAQAAATDLSQNGVVVGGRTFLVRTHVISFGGGALTELNQLAAAGGTSTATVANNEAELTRSLATILDGFATAERCDNADNNCNGCTDEGFAHYANIGQTCCAWATPAQRTTCLGVYQSSITPANPLGNTAQIPCVTALQFAQPATWSCYNPGETCDNADNNGDGQIDEGLLKCGSPAHCPQAETCNGQDDNCNGSIDEGGVCPGGGVAQAEVCNGCDDDLDGFADNGVVGTVACGRPAPANCPGTQSCRPPTPVPAGGCITGSPFTACNNSPQAETCDGLDNDCDGIVDDGVAATTCTPVGTPPGLVFGGSSQCRTGTQACGGACIGFVGPTGEVTDTIDNDCDGIVDNIFQFRNGFE